MRTHHIGVKELVTFLYGTGDLASQSKTKNAQLIGQNHHTERQNGYGEGDRKEVFLETLFSKENIELNVSGRADGVLNREGDLIIEEIKSTEIALSLIKTTTFPAHFMQAYFYAYMFCKTHELKSIIVWLTYIHHPSKVIKTIVKRMRISQLEKAVNETIDAYVKWLNIYEDHQYEKMKTLEGLNFPHEDYREGQYHFMGAIYQTLIKKDILYATAPTGIGKTIGALFSGLKTIKNDREKIFYLTAKNAGKTIAVETMEQLKAHGLKIKAITLNAKDNMCLMDEVDCDPDLCPFAKGYYSRLRKALEDIFVHDDVYDVRLIMDYGKYHTICPHEFALDISNYCDVVICDYNYVFDPRIKLIRYFEESYYKPKLLIDEAHNLVDRTRAMYSASLSTLDIETMKEALKGVRPAPSKHIKALADTMAALIDHHDVRKCRLYVSRDLDGIFMDTVYQLTNKLESLLDAHKKHPKRKAIRDGYFQLLQFMRISEYFSEAFRFTIEAEVDDVVYFNIVCFDASEPVSRIIADSTYGTVLFSATLKPFDYFSNLITQGKGTHFEVPSPFDPDRLGLLVDISTSTKYRERGLSIERIVDTLYAMLETKKGNYIAFFPSYEYLNMVLNAFDGSGYEVMIQSRDMKLIERETFITRFKAVSETSKILFSVLGGSFSEGVDYIGDMLSGVLVVGVALPALSNMNVLLRDYFSEKGFDGFDYAFTYPGMNKVIQAIGRVIRSKDDKGIAILLDNRYSLGKYKALMPSHWLYKTIKAQDYIQTAIRAFWDEFEHENH